MRYEVRQFIGKSPKYRVLDYVSLPIGLHLRRNEQLNEASIQLIDVTQKRRIPKNTRIRIVETESGEKFDFIVVQDVVTRTRAELPELFNHDISLVESTQEFATIQLPNISFSRMSSTTYKISSASEFLAIAQNPYGNYVLTGDITISTEMSGFGIDFAGTLNGMGHTVTISNFKYTNEKRALFNNFNGYMTNINFVVNSTSTTLSMTETNINAGFICCSNNGGMIEKVGILNSRILIGVKKNQLDGLLKFGLIAGNNNTGTILQCKVVNTSIQLVNGDTTIPATIIVGSLCGANSKIGGVANCYVSDGQINVNKPLQTTIQVVGGMVGVQAGVINTSYVSNTQISGISENDVVGSFAPKNLPGENVAKSVNNCYFYPVGSSVDAEVTNSLGTYVETQTDMQNKETFVGFDFETIWDIDNSVSEPFFRVFETLSMPNPLIISNIIKRLLNIAKIRRVGDDQLYYISDDLITKLSNKNLDNATEFFFNELNLLEALREIGQKINAIPYLEDYKYVNYYFLNENASEKVWTPTGEQSCSYSQIQSAEEYSTNLISFGKNIVTSDDTSEGSVEYPINGWTTPRVDGNNTTRINNSTACIDLHGMRIYDIQQVLVKNVNKSNAQQVYDITPFIYEKRQYDLLPDLATPTDTFKEVRGRALIYDQYDSIIYGFTNTPIRGFAPEYPALNNILMAVSGLSESQINTDYKTLLFKVTFRPVFDNVQSTLKTDLEDFPFEEDLVLNQTTNMLSSKNFGNYKRAKMDKMGNIEESRTYQFDTIQDMPKLGYKLAGTDYNVNEIVANVFDNMIIANITFTKNYNKISEFISVNSRKRPYALPIDNTLPRHTAIRKYVNFTTKPYVDVTERSSVESGISSTFFVKLFYPLGFSSDDDTTNYECNLALVETRDENGNHIRSAILPVSSYASPRCLHYSFNMIDNVSAGSQANDIRPSASADYFAQQSVLYTKDGSFKSLYFSLLAGDGGLVGSTINEEINWGKVMPAILSTPTADKILMTETNLDYQKDAREIPYFTEEVHFITDGSVIIGDNMSYNNITVKSSLEYSLGGLYTLDRKLGEYEKTVPSDAVKQQGFSLIAYGISNSNGEPIGARLDISFYSSGGGGGQCYFFADTSGNIILGANEPLSSSRSTIYAYGEKYRELPYEPHLALNVNIDTSSYKTSPFEKIYLYGNDDLEYFNIIDYGDGEKEYFDYIGDTGYFDISHNYTDILGNIVNPANLNIYSQGLKSVDIHDSQYPINYVKLLNSSIDTVRLFNHNISNDNFKSTSLDLSRLTNLKELDCSNWAKLQILTMPATNNLIMVDLSHTGLVNDEKTLKAIANSLPIKPPDVVGGYEFTCEGTQTPDGYAYWQSVADILTSKGWSYNY